jgi:hypothetical protein
MILFYFFLLFAPSLSISGFDCIREDERLIYSNIPNCKGVDDRPGFGTLPFQTNTLGLREKEFSSKAPKGTFRILLLGASDYLNLSDSEGILPRLHSILQKKAKQYGKSCKKLN